MSFIRSILPSFINNNVMYYIGKTQCFIQQFYNNNFLASKITNRIYVGSLADATNIDELKKNGVTHILSVMNGVYELYPNDFNYKLIHINDDKWEKIGKHFNDTTDYIKKTLDENTKNVILIHCQKGISRSVTILLAYLLFMYNLQEKIEKNSTECVIIELLKKIQDNRNIALPNEGFLNELKEYIYILNNY